MQGATATQIQELIARYGLHAGGAMTVEAAGGGTARVTQRVSKANLRPGDTLSGPTLMALADVAMYAAVLGAIGLEPLAVTTNLSMNFLRKPPLAGLRAEARLLKLGRKLAVGEIAIYSEGVAEPVAHATCTYSIPSRG
jgi:uncharacterized protein (TIGR00369 family)